MSNPVEPVTAGDAVVVTASDSATYNSSNGGALDALYIGGGGDVAVKTAKGTMITFPSVLAGSILPIRCQKVLSTGTTATNIVGLKY